MVAAVCCCRTRVVTKPIAAMMVRVSPRLARDRRVSSAITGVLTSAANAAHALTWCRARALGPADPLWPGGMIEFNMLAAKSCGRRSPLEPRPWGTRWHP